MNITLCLESAMKLRRDRGTSLAASRVGRMLLHAGCILRGGKFAFHTSGIVRELKEFFRSYLKRALKGNHLP